MVCLGAVHSHVDRHAELQDVHRIPPWNQLRGPRRLVLPLQQRPLRLAELVQRLGRIQHLELDLGLRRKPDAGRRQHAHVFGRRRHPRDGGAGQRAVGAGQGADAARADHVARVLARDEQDELGPGGGPRRRPDPGGPQRQDRRHRRRPPPELGSRHRRVFGLRWRRDLPADGRHLGALQRPARRPGSPQGGQVPRHGGRRIRRGLDLRPRAQRDGVNPVRGRRARVRAAPRRQRVELRGARGLPERARRGREPQEVCHDGTALRVGRRRGHRGQGRLPAGGLHRARVGRGGRRRGAGGLVRGVLGEGAAGVRRRAGRKRRGCDEAGVGRCGVDVCVRGCLGGRRSGWSGRVMLEGGGGAGLERARATPVAWPAAVLFLFAARPLYHRPWDPKAAARHWGSALVAAPAFPFSLGLLSSRPLDRRFPPKT